MRRFLVIFAAICWLTLGCNALPTLYAVDEDSHVAEPVMIPVASTVIPLEDLPVFKVGLGFGLSTDNKDEKSIGKKKPDNLKEIQLITTRNQHRFVAAAGVQELTKEEFEQFSLSKK